MQRLHEIDGLYHLDPAHSALGFTVRHAGLSRVRGTFDSFHGYAVFDRANIDNSALMVSIQVASINTQQRDRDAHLRAPDFFDAERFPAITFVGTRFRLLDEQRVLVGGDLTIRDVTQPLEIEFEYAGSAVDPSAARRIGFEGATSISRKQFGLTWNAALETGGWLISDEAQIEVEVSAVQQDEQIEQRALRRAQRAGVTSGGSVVGPRRAASEPRADAVAPRPRRAMAD